MLEQYKKEKLDYIQIIRGIAFLGVFLSHTGIKAFSASGAWGVSVFFILSGFLMTYNYYGKSRIRQIGIKDNLHFSFCKIKKLYFLHILMICAELLLFFCQSETLGIRAWINEGSKVLLNVCLLQAWIPKNNIYFSLNGVSWYLSVCCFLYFLFPWFLKLLETLGKNRRNVKNSIIVIYVFQIILCYGFSIIPVADVIRDDFVHWGTYILPITRMGDFLIGCNLGYLFITKSNIQTSNIICKMKASFMCVVIVLQWKIHVFFYDMFSKAVPHPETWWMNTVFFSITSCCLIYIFAQVQWGSENIIIKSIRKILIYVGDISSYGFLIHLVVIRYIRISIKYFSGKSIQGTVVLAISSFIITIIISEIYRWLEKKIGYSQASLVLCQDLVQNKMRGSAS